MMRPLKYSWELRERPSRMIEDGINLIKTKVVDLIFSRILNVVFVLKLEAQVITNKGFKSISGFSGCEGEDMVKIITNNLLS
jgi:hypothetical protein